MASRFAGTKVPTEIRWNETLNVIGDVQIAAPHNLNSGDSVSTCLEKKKEKKMNKRYTSNLNSL